MARTKTAEQNSTSQQQDYPKYEAYTTTTAEVQTIPTWMERTELLVARRLYEVWVTSGQLGGAKWDWANQSTRSQQAWVNVARAVMGPALQAQFGPQEIARLMHG